MISQPPQHDLSRPDHIPYPFHKIIAIGRQPFIIWLFFLLLLIIPEYLLRVREYIPPLIFTFCPQKASARTSLWRLVRKWVVITRATTGCSCPCRRIDFSTCRIRVMFMMRIPDNDRSNLSMDISSILVFTGSSFSSR